MTVVLHRFAIGLFLKGVQIGPLGVNEVLPFVGFGVSALKSQSVWNATKQSRRKFSKLLQNTAQNNYLEMRLPELREQYQLSKLVDKNLEVAQLYGDKFFDEDGTVDYWPHELVLNFFDSFLHFREKKKKGQHSHGNR